jgi:hypothetical protein
MLLANTIEDNDAGGILIEGDGAEGNAIGVQVVDGANDLPTIANAPIEPNVVSGNGGYAIQVDGDQARYNLISGGNTISADGGDAAIYLSNGARANIIGDGGEGFSEQDQGYIEGHGNRIEYGAGQVGVKSDANPGVNPGDGGEGNTIIGNNFVGDLSSAISLTNPNTAHFVPPVLTNLQVATNGQNEVTEINVDYELPADAALRDVQGARFRIDFYLLDGQGQRIYLGGPLAYDPYTGQTTFTWPNNSGLTSFSGWQLAATTTYYLANDELRIGSLTSELTLLPIS